MAITNYTELKDTVADYLVRDDLVTRIPTFISLAEYDFDRTLRTHQMEERWLTDTVEDENYIALPPDFLEMRSLNLQTTPRQALGYYTPSTQEYGAFTSGLPMSYTISGTELRIGPKPGAGHVVEAIFYKRIPKLSDDNPTNWLLEAHPDAYLFGALMQAQPFLYDAETFAQWAQVYAKVMDGIDRLEKRTKWNAGPLQPYSDVVVV